MLRHGSEGYGAGRRDRHASWAATPSRSRANSRRSVVLRQRRRDLDSGRDTGDRGEPEHERGRASGRCRSAAGARCRRRRSAGSRAARSPRRRAARARARRASARRGSRRRRRRSRRACRLRSRAAARATIVVALIRRAARPRATASSAGEGERERAGRDALLDRRAEDRAGRRRQADERGVAGVDVPLEGVEDRAGQRGDPDRGQRGRRSRPCRRSRATRISSGTITIPPPTPKRALKSPATRPMGDELQRHRSYPRAGGGRPSARAPRRGARAGRDPARRRRRAGADRRRAARGGRAGGDARRGARRLHERYALVACISGRSGADARRIVGLDELVYVGEHGLELVPEAAEWSERLQAFAATVDWDDIERKPLTVTFHYRRAEDEAEALAMLEAVGGARAARGPRGALRTEGAGAATADRRAQGNGRRASARRARARARALRGRRHDRPRRLRRRSGHSSSASAWRWPRRRARRSCARPPTSWSTAPRRSSSCCACSRGEAPARSARRTGAACRAGSRTSPARRRRGAARCRAWRAVACPPAQVDQLLVAEVLDDFDRRRRNGRSLGAAVRRPRRARAGSRRAPGVAAHSLDRSRPGTRFIAGEPMKPRHEDVGRLRVELLGRADLLEHAELHHRDPVAHRHRLDLVVGHVDRRRLEAALELQDLGARLDAQRRVEVGERLVHQERLRLAHDRAAEGDPLPLAARELLRLALDQLVQVEDLGARSSRARRSRPLRHLRGCAARRRGCRTRSCAGRARRTGRPSRCPARRARGC